MTNLKLNDISMYYAIHGAGEPIVFIAGFGMDHTSWQTIVDKFKDYYQVILFDNRGAGQTDVPDGPYTIEEMAHDVVQLCAKLGVIRAHFIGNSMGGFILQTIAYKHPELVKSAIISNSTATPNTCFYIYADAQLELLKTEASLTALAKASCSWAFSFQFLSRPGMIEHLIQLGLENPYPFSVKGYAGQYAAIAQFDSKTWVNQIQVPTLVLAADQDLVFVESSVKLLADQIPNASYYCFEECGHLPHIEYPEQFSKVILAFIEGLSEP